MFSNKEKGWDKKFLAGRYKENCMKPFKKISLSKPRQEEGLTSGADSLFLDKKSRVFLTIGQTMKNILYKVTTWVFIYLSTKIYEIVRK